MEGKGKGKLKYSKGMHVDWNLGRPGQFGKLQIIIQVLKNNQYYTKIGCNKQNIKNKVACHTKRVGNAQQPVIKKLKGKGFVVQCANK